MFLIGEIVFYPVFGAGCIINIEEKEICGEIKKYYIIKLIINDMKVMVPLDSKEAKKLRAGIGPKDCDDVIDILKSDPVPIPGKWSERYKFYNQSIKEGDIYKLALILRDIAGLSRTKSLSKSEINVFKEILHMVCGELALVLKKSYKDTITFVLDIFKLSNNFC